jgi:hypothetical protein
LFNMLFWSAFLPLQSNTQDNKVYPYSYPDTIAFLF